MLGFKIMQLILRLSVITFLNFHFSFLYAQPLYDDAIRQQVDTLQNPFCFGVASGDPDQNSVVLWTKVYTNQNLPVNVNWVIATDTLLNNISASGKLTVDCVNAYTVKVHVTNLLSNTTYFYRFETSQKYSPVGRTRTSPVTTEELNFAVVSCSNYQHGYFNAYRLVAERNEINAVIHLGDYIYEYGISKLNGKSTVREHVPAHEIVSLKDYRSRYAQYRLDNDLQEAHRLHPFIVEWDDHEFANDTYKDGAKNHQPEQDGDWEQRKANAKQAYFEWLPITESKEHNIVRKISYGNLADIFLLDGRVEGRSKQGETPYDPVINSPNQHMLGDEQTRWLLRGVQTSEAKWKVIANQVVFSEVDAHQLTKKHAINQDAWDGYPAERKQLFDSFYANGVKNLVIITGDIHLSWAFDLVQNPKDKERYDRKTGKGVIGAEFVTPSITSNGVGEKFNKFVAKLIATVLARKATNPHLIFQELTSHGYLHLNLTAQRATATWNLLKTVRKKTTEHNDKFKWYSEYNYNSLKRISPN